jgi:hypothetical protein
MRVCGSCLRLTRIGDWAEHTTILRCGETSEALEEAPEKGWVVVPHHCCNVVGRPVAGFEQPLREGLWGMYEWLDRATGRNESLFVGSEDPRAGVRYAATTSTTSAKPSRGCRWCNRRTGDLTTHGVRASFPASLLRRLSRFYVMADFT